MEGACWIRTISPCRVKDFDALLATAEECSLLAHLADDDVGAVTAMLATRTGAMLTSQTIYVDSGCHIRG
jgi:enoyl-[acyl-carrier protein] reductase I